MATTRAFLSLGSNLGDRAENLRRAFRELAARGFPCARRSSLYLTEPVGGPPQDWFVNAVAEILTGETAEALLAACLDVERAMGRVRTEKDGPRTIDLDLLLFGNETRDTPTLTLPHPRLHERRFVLLPLAEIAPDARHPRLGATAAEMLARCPDTKAVELYAKAETGG
jgi:2-amino-4-hydroxy-6-hydroxymethyldihydropteridine diphosphokinase